MKVVHMVASVLLYVGGVNWGLVGLGTLLGGGDWNVVNMLLGSMPVVEAVVYVLVGVAAVYVVVTHRQSCKDCSVSPM